MGGVGLLYTVEIENPKYRDRATEIEVALDNGKPYEEAVRLAFEGCPVQLQSLASKIDAGRLYGKVAFWVFPKGESSFSVWIESK
jgi:hypothetical protein